MKDNDKDGRSCQEHKRGCQPAKTPTGGGFYHEPFYDDTLKKNQAWADLRASKSSR